MKKIGIFFVLVAMVLLFAIPAASAQDAPAAYNITYKLGNAIEEYSGNMYTKLPLVSRLAKDANGNPVGIINADSTFTSGAIQAADIEQVTAMLPESENVEPGTTYVLPYLLDSTGNEVWRYEYTNPPIQYNYFVGWIYVNNKNVNDIKIYQPGETFEVKDGDNVVLYPMFVVGYRRDVGIMLFRYQLTEIAADGTLVTNDAYMLERIPEKGSSGWLGNDSDYWGENGWLGTPRPFSAINALPGNYEDPVINNISKRLLSLKATMYKTDKNTGKRIAEIQTATSGVTGNGPYEQTTPFDIDLDGVYMIYVDAEYDKTVIVDTGGKDNGVDAKCALGEEYTLPSPNETNGVKIAKWKWTGKDGSVKTFDAGSSIKITEDLINATSSVTYQGVEVVVDSVKLEPVNAVKAEIRYYNGVWKTNEDGTPVLDNGYLVEDEDAAVSNIPNDIQEVYVLDGSITMPATAPIREGWKFTGWYMDYTLVNNYRDDILGASHGQNITPDNQNYFYCDMIKNGELMCKKYVAAMPGVTVPSGTLASYKVSNPYCIIATWDELPSVSFANPEGAADLGLEITNLPATARVDGSFTCPTDAAIPQSSEYEFLGWRASWERGDKLYKPGEEVIIPFDKSYSDTAPVEGIMTAVWRQYPSVDINSGEVDESDLADPMPKDIAPDKNLETGYPVALTASDPDYIFKGWEINGVLVDELGTLKCDPLAIPSDRETFIIRVQEGTYAYTATAKWDKKVTITIPGVTDIENPKITGDGIRGDSFVLPEEAPAAPSGNVVFGGYKASWDNKTYQPGDEIVFPENDGALEPIWNPIPNDPQPPQYDDSDFIYVSPSVDPIVKPAEPVAVSEICYVVTASRLNIRTLPDSGSARIGRVSRGTLLHGEMSGGWLKMLYNGKTAYVSADYLSATEELHESYESGITGVITCRDLNMRKGPSTSYEKAGMLHRDDQVKIQEKCGDWYRIEVNGYDGELWISSKYVSIIK